MTDRQLAGIEVGQSDGDSPIVQSRRHVVFVDQLALGEVSDRPSDATDPVKSSSREPPCIERALKQDGCARRGCRVTVERIDPERRIVRNTTGPGEFAHTCHTFGHDCGWFPARMVQ